MKIHLHGFLKDLHSKPINVQASSVAEALSALQLIPALNTGKHHEIMVEGFLSRDAIYDRTEVEEIHIHPMMVGAGKPGLTQIIIGITLIAIAIYNPGGLTILGSQISSGSLMLTGALMVAGGVMQMLAPQPKLGDMTKDKSSRYLGGPKNTVAIGTRIPLIYGRRKAYGHYISFDIDALDMGSAPALWYASTFTANGILNEANSPLTNPLPLPSTVDGKPQAFYQGTRMTDTINDPRVFIVYSPSLFLTDGVYSLTFQDGVTIQVSSYYTSGQHNLEVLSGTPPSDSMKGTLMTFRKLPKGQEMINEQ